MDISSSRRGHIYSIHKLRKITLVIFCVGLGTPDTHRVLVAHIRSVDDLVLKGVCLHTVDYSNKNI